MFCFVTLVLITCGFSSRFSFPGVPILSAYVRRVPLILILYSPQYGIEVTTAARLSVRASGVFLGAGVPGVLGWWWGVISGTRGPFWASCSFGHNQNGIG